MLVLRPLSYKIGLLDRPCSRKRHQIETPLIGGLAIYICFALLTPLHAVDMPASVPFLVAISIIVIIGLLDDFNDLGFRTRLVAEVIAGFIMIKWGGVEITSLGNLFGFGEIELGVLSVPFTIFAIVGGINAFNMIDGIDGLAGSTSLIAYLLLSVLYLLYGGPDLMLFCFIFAPATIAFLIFNFPMPLRRNAAAFLGDTGSMLFGFTIACLVIAASQGEHKIISPVTVLWIIGAPILDTVCIMLRRIRKGLSPFAPDREHLHHILTVVGYGKYARLFLILLFGTTVSLIGLAGDLILRVPDGLMLALFLTLFFVYYWSMNHAWRMVTVARYLREHSLLRSGDIRRTTELTALPFDDRRVIPDRRHQEEIEGIGQIIINNIALIHVIKRFFIMTGDLYRLLRRMPR